MSVLNVKSIKVTNVENIDNLPIQVPPKGIWGIHFGNWRGARDTARDWRGARDTVRELEGSTRYNLGTGG